MATESHTGLATTESAVNLKVEYPIYGSSRVGIKHYNNLTLSSTQSLADATVTADNYSRILGSKNYELSNPLGNVLTTISDRKIAHDGGSGVADYYVADVTSAQDYYPFGMVMPGRSFSTPEYRYGFNGMEKDDEVTNNDGSHLDFGARIYDSRIGRWLSVDPLSRKYAELSPYNYVANNPIAHVDKDGRDYDLYINHETKTVIIKAGFWSIDKSDRMLHLTQKATNFVNAQNGKFKYAVGRGKDVVIYDIEFHAVNGNDGMPEDAPTSNVVAPASEQVLNKGRSPGEGKVQGRNVNDMIYISNEVINEDRGLEVTEHETGHALGMVHSTYGIMTETGSGEGLSTDNVESILGRAGFGKKRKLRDNPVFTELGKAVNVQVVGNNNMFNSGRVVTQKKADRLLKHKERLLTKEAKKKGS